MNRPKPIEFTFTHRTDEVPLPIAPPGSLLQTNEGFRTFRPVILQDKCVKCMMCYVLCPDGTIYKENENLVVDYDYCKGCGICAHECKVKAIDMVPEE